MTEIEKKALALLNECAGQEVYGGWGTFDPNQSPCTRALCRAIEQHEAFRQEVSDALEKRGYYIDDRDLGRFIIAKSDPRLAEVWGELFHKGLNLDGFLAALAKRGLEIREKQ